MKKPVIAIDGFSSTGKSSISKKIAKKLGLIHLDTGALYRGITYFGLQNYKDADGINTAELIKNLNKINLEFNVENNELILLLNGKNISKEIRDPKVSESVSHVAKQQEVRDFLLETQQKLAENGGIIMDGRDIGTVVLPNADYKFFLTASIEERTRRRYRELMASDANIDEISVKNNLIERDKIDSERAIAPLKQSPDAILIDNTSLDKAQTVELILSYLK